MSKHAIILIIVLLLFVSLTNADIITVRKDGTGDCSKISAAIEEAHSGDTIIVGDGTWSGTKNTNLGCDGKAITVKSENGPDNCIIDCGFSSRAFILESYESGELVIDGFSIINGTGQGAAIAIYYSSPTITNCVFSNNDADDTYGGAISCCYSQASITSCTFADNSADSGAAIYMNEGASITDCKFYDNTASYAGGAIYLSYYNRDDVIEPTVISGCVFGNNIASAYGGAVASFATETILNECSFDGNYSPLGGAVCLTEGGYASIDHCRFIDNFSDRGSGVMVSGYVKLNLYNSIFDRNLATMRGGAISIESSLGLNITNCLFDHNTALEGTGVIYGSDGEAAGPGRVTNCTFVGNSNNSNDYPSIDSRYSDEIYYKNCIFHNNTYPLFYSNSIMANISYSCVQYAYETTPYNWADSNSNFTTADPMFATGPQGDYYLSQISAGQSQNSPCIDSGTGCPKDYGLQDITTRTDQVQDLSVIDIGYHYPSLIGDLNSDGLVNLLDLSLLASAYGQNNQVILKADKLACWLLDEASGDYIYDSSQSNLTGTMYNFDPSTAWQPGISGTSLTFDGVDDYIEVPFILDPAAGPFSLSVWVYGNSTGTVLQQLDGTGTGRKWLTFTSEAIKTYLTQDDSYGSLDADLTLSSDRWHNIVFVWDGLKRYIYADSELIAADSTDLTGLEPCDGACYIGCGKYGPPSSIFTGTIDNICVYADVLSQQEITNLFAEGNYFELGWWQFEEGTGTTACSSGDTTLTATLNNMTEASWTDQGIFGNALSFDGIDDYLSTPFVINPSSGPCSAFVWIKSSSESTGLARRILSQGASDDGTCSWLSQDADGYLIAPLYQYDSGSFLQSSYNIADDTWHNVGAVIDDTYVYLYVDGNIVAQTQHYNNVASSTGPLHIGTNPAATNKFWLGLMDDVRVYDFALNAQQIEQVRTGGHAMYIEYTCDVQPEADINHDCKVNLDDLLHMATRWLQ